MLSVKLQIRLVYEWYVERVKAQGVQTLLVVQKALRFEQT